MKVFNVFAKLLTFLFVYPTALIFNYKKNKLKKLIEQDDKAFQKSNDYYSLKRLAWDYFNKSKFELAKNIALHQVKIVSLKSDFPGSVGLLANAYSVLGLIALASNKQQAIDYLMKSAPSLITSIKQDEKLLLLPQNLIEEGCLYEVQKFLKLKVNYMKNISTPKFTQAVVKNTVLQLEKFVKDLNQGKRVELIIK